MESITIKDVARICGVGVSTVSRAINNHPDINSETKEKILRVINENNYIPNNSARNLKRTEANTIAIIIKGINNPFFQGMISIFEQETTKRNFSFIMQSVDEHSSEIEIAMQLEKEKRLKGLIFLGGMTCCSEADMRQFRVPAVLCSVNMLEDVARELYSSVSIDDINESYKLVDYLCSLGHKRIAMINARGSGIGKNRYLGYRKALEKNGIEFDPALIRYMKDDITEFTMANGYAVAKELIESGTEFTALFSISDTIAFGASKAITDKGFRIPEDYSVVGFDGIEMAAYYNPSLTTIRQPLEKMARESTKQLFNLIEGCGQHRHLIYEAELIEGNSVKKISEQ